MGFATLHLTQENILQKSCLAKPVGLPGTARAFRYLALDLVGPSHLTYGVYVKADWLSNV